MACDHNINIYKRLRRPSKPPRPHKQYKGCDLHLLYGSQFVAIKTWLHDSQRWISGSLLRLLLVLPHDITLAFPFEINSYNNTFSTFCAFSGVLVFLAFLCMHIYIWLTQMLHPYWKLKLSRCAASESAAAWTRSSVNFSLMKNGHVLEVRSLSLIASSAMVLCLYNSLWTIWGSVGRLEPP